MKAIIYKEYGSAEVLRLAEVKLPETKRDELLIKVMAVEATKADCEMRSFRFAVSWFWLPLRIAFGITKPKKTILGSYFSGVIEAVGDDVSKFSKGDEVFGVSGMAMGAYGEYMCIPVKNTLVKKPENIGFAEAAAVPLGGLNALHFMRRAQIKPGHKILINGAGGSIGLFAVQIAKAMGAEVTAVDSAIKETMLRDIGAAHFIDYHKDNFADSQEKYHVIFDMVAQSSYSAAIRSLKPEGCYLIGNPRMSDMLRSVLSTKLTDKTVFFAFAQEKQEELMTLKDMLEQGKIKAVVDKVYAPEQAADAHRRVESEQRIGSVVLSFIAEVGR
jgi:NADPH:quinone reductase-like Zn-dependent oxidoreductase